MEDKFRYVKDETHGLHFVAKYKDHKDKLKEVYGYTDKELKLLDKFKQPVLKASKQEALERLI